MAELRVERRPEGAEEQAAVFALIGDFTVERLEEVEQALAAALEGRARHLVLDLSRLDFIDSASVGGLLHLGQRQGRAGSRLLLCAPKPAFQRLLDASGLLGAFTVQPDVATALARL
jgi:anti-anti-sigma factor